MTSRQAWAFFWVIKLIIALPVLLYLVRRYFSH